jgi:protein O-GlcNAc transferase
MTGSIVSKSRIPIFIVLFSISIGTATPAPAADNSAEKLAKATDSLNKGKAKAAAAIARSVIADNPNNAQAHTTLGAALASMVDDDNYDAAIEEEKTALKLDPNSYWARKFLGKIYTNLHKTDEAITVLTEACSVNPCSYAARRDLAIAQTTAGKNDEAMKSFRAAIQINPAKMDSHLKLSALLVKTDNYKEAIAEARKAVKLDVSNPETHLALANAILASGDKIASIEEYENAMQANESKSYRNALTQAAALSGLGWAFSVPNAGKKELSQAVSYQQQAIKMFPGYGPAYVRLAELLGRQGKIKSAEAMYKNSVRLSQEDAGVSTAYAKFLIKNGRSEEARNLLKKVLEKTPNCKQASDALAELNSEKAS